MHFVQAAVQIISLPESKTEAFLKNVFLIRLDIKSTGAHVE